jgi:Fe-coproporphyrin III synthase
LELRAGRFARSIAALNLNRLSLPFRINFCVTYACQSRCTMCNIWDIRPKGELTMDEIWAFAEKNPYFTWVQLTGGEPTMRRDLSEIARVFENTSHPYILTSQTNSLSHPRHVEAAVREMAALPIPHFIYTLSLDGPREVHDRQRGVPGNFDKVMEVYRRLSPLKKERPGFGLVFGFTMTKLNQGMVLDTVKAVQSIYPEVREEDFHLNMAQVSEHYYGNETGNGFAPDPLTAAEEVRMSLGRRNHSGVMGWAERRFLAGLVDFAKTGRPPIRSRELMASLYMDSWGDVYPSVMWGLKLGSIRQSGYDLRPIWGGDVAESARQALKMGMSPKSWTSCEAYSSILGGIGR